MKIKSLSLILAVLAFAFFACNDDKSKSGSAELTNETDSLSYCLGVSLGTNLKEAKLTEINPDVLGKTINQVLAGDSNLLMNPQEANVFLQSFFQRKYEAMMKANLEEGKKFLEENKKKEGVLVTASGLQYQIIKNGEGPMPNDSSTVTVHYHGTLMDGTVFDSSVERGQPATFVVNRVIRGWTEALKMMNAGSKWKLFIPSDLAYGENPMPGSGIEPNVPLIFEVELLSIGE